MSSRSRRLPRSCVSTREHFHGGSALGRACRTDVSESGFASESPSSVPGWPKEGCSAMGVVTRNGRLVVDVSFRNADGTTTRVQKISPIQTPRGASVYERQLLSALARGEYRKPKPQAQTLSEFAAGYLKRAAVNTKRSSSTSTRHMLNGHVLPLLGHLKLDAIGYKQIEELKDSLLQKKLAPKTVNNVVSGLTGLLREAVDMELLDRVPKVKWLPRP